MGKEEEEKLLNMPTKSKLNEKKNWNMSICSFPFVEGFLDKGRKHCKQVNEMYWKKIKRKTRANLVTLNATTSGGG